MEQKIGRTFAEAVNEHLAKYGNLDKFHRDIDEVLGDPSLKEIVEKYFAALETQRKEDE